MNERWGVYCRISRARRTDGKLETLGVDRQEPPCRALVERLGGTVAEVYVDNDESAFNGHRPRFEDMLRDLDSGRIKGVATWAHDRLSRDPDKDNVRILELVERRGSKLATVGGEYDLGTPSGRLHFRIMGSIARHESEHRAERLRLKHEELASAGTWPGGQAPYGYRLRKVKKDGAKYTTLEPDPDTAPIVAEVVGRVLQGETLGTVIRDLNSPRRAVPSPKGKRWQATPLRKIITSPAIAGLRQHHGEIAGKAKWPPLITPSEHQRLRALFADKAKRRRQGRGRRFLLTGGLARCGECGRPLSSARYKNGRLAYACRTDAGGCGGVVISALDLEHLITEGVIDALCGPRLARLLAQAEYVETDRLARELADADRHLKALAELHGRGEIEMAEWLVAAGPVRQRRDVLRARVQEAPDAELLADLPRTEKELRATWEAKSVDWRRARVALVLNHVVVRSAKKVGRSLEARVDPDWRV
jgi:DNA invertase Pin-like site-specific DNA recombinase